MFKNFIFDLDGTLINSSKEVMICFERAFDKANFEIDKSRLTPNVIGPPLREILLNIAPNLTDEKMLDTVMQNFRSVYDNDENDISEIYAGVYEVLDELKQMGCRIFMATFKPTASTMRIVKQFKLDYFEEIFTIDKYEKHITKEEMIKIILEKYDLKKEETVMVGDAASDMRAAKAAGVYALAALWGYGDDKRPLIETSDAQMESMKEIWQKLNFQTI